MFSIIFKKIFEVRILHDYFLATKSSSFFALNDQEQKDQLLEKYNLDMGDELEIRPTPSCIELMKNHKLRFINTKLGFFVVQEVEKIVLPTGAVKYKPILPLEDNSGLSFHIKSINGLFQNFTGIPFKKTSPSIYYFSNQDDNNDKAFPALSLPVALFSTATTYEMGTLVDFDPDGIKEAKEETQVPTPNQWQDVAGEGLVNRLDCSLLPQKFYFQLPLPNLLSSIEIRLLDMTNTLLSTDNVDIETGNIAVIDFCKDPVEDCLEEGWYKIEIIGGGNLLFSQTVLISDKLYNTSHFGIIEIFQNSSNDFDLLDTNGFIHHSINADETINNHPIFEIRLRSRSTYWRYKSNEGFSPSDISDTNQLLTVDPNSNNTILVSKATTTILRKTNKPVIVGGNAMDLPNPHPASLKYGTDGKIYSDIYISTINRLIN